MVAYIGLSTQPVFYNGRILPGAKVYVYDAGTNTPRTTYSDGQASVEHPWPIVTDANGCIPPFWVNGGNIKVQITTAGGAVIRTIDEIQGDPTVTGGGGGGGGGTTIPPAFMMPSHRTGVVDGWVRANGRTIGSAASGATERANADTEDLYTVLWNDANLSVSGGRGASAADDFAANKTIALPDYRGLPFFGLADMGSSDSGRLNGVTFSSGNKTTLGSVAGAVSRTILEANLPSHTHSGTTAAQTDHTHTVTVSADGGETVTSGSGGGHTHTATQAAHTHSYTTPAAGLTDAVGPGITSSAAGTTGSAQPAITVDAVAAHTHSVTTNDHTHPASSDPAGGHSHSFTTGATGSGTALETTPPLKLCTVYMKL